MGELYGQRAEEHALIVCSRVCSSCTPRVRLGSAYTARCLSALPAALTHCLVTWMESHARAQPDLIYLGLDGWVPGVTQSTYMTKVLDLACVGGGDVRRDADPGDGEAA